MKRPRLSPLDWLVIAAAVVVGCYFASGMIGCASTPAPEPATRGMGAWDHTGDLLDLGFGVVIFRSGR